MSIITRALGRGDIARALARGATASGLAAALGLGIAGTSASAQSWDIPTPYGDATFHTQNIRTFAEDIAEATGGDLTITVHSAGSLYKHPEIKDAVRRGLAPIC